MQSIIAGVLLFLLLLTTAAANAAPPPQSSIMVKTGDFSLHDHHQGIAGPPQLFLDFEDRDAHAVGVEYEWRFRSNYSAGLDWIRYRVAWTSATAEGYGGVAPVWVLGLNIKKYFEPLTWLRPYFGVGAGIGRAVFQGPGWNDAPWGGVIHVLLGVELRVSDHFGLHLQAKEMLMNNVKNFHDGDSLGDKNLDLSGTVYLAGVSFHF